MNKELILKYKAEFDHWINGGTLQYRLPNGDSPVWKDSNEISDTQSYEVWSRGTYVIFVIDDAYVEFRKALAEGKTVQSNFGIMGFGCPDTWTDMSGMFGYKFEHKLECYRIKPDEPKFNEWYWFWDEHIDSYRTLAQYHGKGPEEYPYKTAYGENYKYCEPFIGSLPTNLQN